MGVPSVKTLTRISGTGLAPWEIHRPQKFVRDLVLRGCFTGRVLDAGCGIGDNALFIAKACPQAHVTAVDVSPRCVAFAAAKAGLRRMTADTVTLETASLTEPDPARQAACVSSPAADGTFDVVLDSSTFHCFGNGDRQLYVASLRRLLRPGGMLFVNCMSEEETRPGGPRRVTVAELLSAFNRQSGWEVEVIEDCYIELHPTFWGGRAASRLFTVRRL
ncbi:hypothetical protein HYH02_014365 [Chlamydomonas schloesseri]|uniref:Methyltransferase type 12 domain-containing protein n=1 Tax=Chlamydomonas schloesseri TaxID=2026947 RepID=A0A835VXC9_9CHLO|nr:hypothetical protein HYH02_014365 [Chlamydomonas schloesseri]|eukprot:KAG2428561.1 hypothetical protein HYH02_014365 [Chlamydomonas schloesseri]